MTTILLLHGWRSVPSGVKPTYQKQADDWQAAPGSSSGFATIRGMM
jgi:hypothetical protein